MEDNLERMYQPLFALVQHLDTEWQCVFIFTVYIYGNIMLCSSLLQKFCKSYNTYRFYQCLYIIVCVLCICLLVHTLVLAVGGDAG